jgi:EpsI family protein
MKDSTPRFIVAALLIAAAAIFLHAHSGGEFFPQRLTLQSFPATLGSWEGEDVEIDKDVREVLGPGDFLLRVYKNVEQAQPNIDLFIAYFPTQRAGDTIHSPQNCLPGAGWTPLKNTRVMLTFPGHKPFPANRYVIEKGDAREMVLYWYWAHDRGVASEYWAKYHLVADSIRLNRSDGALVRLSTRMYPGETAEEAQQRVLPIAGKIMPMLDAYIPR